MSLLCYIKIELIENKKIYKIPLLKQQKKSLCKLSYFIRIFFHFKDLFESYKILTEIETQFISLEDLLRNKRVCALKT